ncbi:MAG: hypothetical protein AB7K24_08395 [Gemmataceae bacterium]
MQLPAKIAEAVRRRIEYLRVHRPHNLSSNGRNHLVVACGIGYECCLSPDGDAYIENFDEDVLDRSWRAEILVVTLGARNWPRLKALVPRRPKVASVCRACAGQGEFKNGPLCWDCCGLGWLHPALGKA